MNDSAAMKEGEVGVGGDSVGGLCVCECVKICVCVPEDCSCWRWWWGGGVEKGWINKLSAWSTDIIQDNIFHSRFSL